MNKAIPLIAAGAGGALAGYLLHDEVKKDIDYGSYLLPHKYYVFKASRELGLPLTRALGHDLSKFRPDEWTAHANWFNGPKGMQGERDPETFLKYKESRRVHSSRNEHHWRMQGLTPEQVSMDTKLETIADWYGVHRATGKTEQGFKDWFETIKHNLPIDNETKRTVEERLYKKATAYYVAASLQKDVKKELPKLNSNIHNNAHITLKFLGTVAPEELSKLKHDLKDIAANHRKFTTSLTGYNNFSNNKKNPVFYAVVSPHGALKTLQEDINENIGIPETREYRPHVTLERKLGPTFDNYITKLPINQIQLLKITPGKNKINASFRLKNPNIFQSIWDKVVNE